MKFIRVLKASDWKVEKISETDWVIKSPDGTYKNSNGKDYHFKTKEDALEELDYLRAEHKFDKKSNIKRQAATVQIDMEDYIDALENRLKIAHERWGGYPELDEQFLDLIRESYDGQKVPSVSAVVDNYVVNGEYVNKEDFTPEGNYSSLYEQYNGDWQELCQNEGVLYNDDVCCIRLGF